MENSLRSRFGFIGFGLIGGSIALALKAQHPDSFFLAYNYYETKPHKRLEEAKKRGILSAVTADLSDFSDCDVIFLCAPVKKNVSYLEKLKPYLNQNCILTDVGSVKGDIHRAVAGLSLERQFIGGHPMTGSEKTGFENASATLFADAYYLITPTDKTDPVCTAWLEEFVAAAGGNCMELDYRIHDQITAAISHCPHIISAVLVNTVAARDDAKLYRTLAAGGFRDITRISSSSPEIWENICMTNKDSILPFLDDYIKNLTQVRECIDLKDSETLKTLFDKAKTYRDAM